MDWAHMFLLFETGSLPNSTFMGIIDNPSVYIWNINLSSMFEYGWQHFVAKATPSMLKWGLAPYPKGVAAPFGRP